MMPGYYIKKILWAFLLGMGFSSYGQQDPLFTQYMFNKLVVNPAYAGSHEQLAIDVVNRNQWAGIDGAPNTFSFGAHLATANRKVGLGLYGYRDELGPSVNQGLMAAYSYRLLFDNSTLSFGLQGGIKYFDYNWSRMVLLDPDNLFTPGEINRITPDMNLGVYFESPRFFAGLSSKQLLENEYGKMTDSDGNSSFSRLLRHFYLMTGAVFPVGENIGFRPSLLAKYVKNAPLQWDLNASFVFNRLFWVGASFRTKKAVAFLAEFRINDWARLGYSYDLYLDDLQSFNYGSHEIRLGFDLNIYHPRIKNPRFFF
jgi:type IX secretion system PorP/SprF family membrane protein